MIEADAERVVRTEATHAPRYRTAFTLIELVVTLIILGLLAGVAAVAIGGSLRSQRSQLAAERFVGWDAHVRRFARSEDRSLTIGRGQRAATGDTLVAAEDPTRGDASIVALASPPVRRVRLLSTSDGWTSDPIAWRMSTDTIAPSLAVAFEPERGKLAATENATRDGPMVVVAGLTGQAIVVEEMEWIDELANALQTLRPLAH